MMVFKDTAVCAVGGVLAGRDGEWDVSEVLAGWVGSL